MNLPTASQFSRFEGLQVTAKKLIYSCNLKIQWDQNHLRATGNLRLGPLKTNVEMETSFQDSGEWSAFHLKAEARNYWLTYELDQKTLRILHSSSNDPTPAELPEGEGLVFDPLLLLVMIYTDEKNGKELLNKYQTFSGPKLTVIEQNASQFFRKNKKIFTLVQNPGLELIIPQFRVRLELKNL